VNYESMILVSDTISKEDADVLNEKVLSYIKENKGQIIKSQDWGKKVLAYPIKKKERAYYYLNHFDLDIEKLDGLEKLYRYDEKIIRFLTLVNEK